MIGKLKAIACIGAFAAWAACVQFAHAQAASGSLGAAQTVGGQVVQSQPVQELGFDAANSDASCVIGSSLTCLPASAAEAANAGWQATVSLSSGTNTALHAACGAGLRNYVVTLDYSTVATTVADTLSLNDNTTAIWASAVAAGAGSRALAWTPEPKVGTANTAMNVQLSGSPTGAVTVNASGYCAP